MTNQAFPEPPSETLAELTKFVTNQVKPVPPPPLRARVLDSVKNTICNDRQDQHGAPEQTHAQIARLWSAYLTGKFGYPVSIDAVDAAQMMVLFKVARTQANPKTQDTWYDEVGYAAIAAELALKGHA